MTSNNVSKIAVLGLWHQGLVAAACLADVSYRVVGSDIDRNIVENLKIGKLPVDEPGLKDLVTKGLASKYLSFDSDMRSAVEGAPFVFLMYDTPVDGNDRSDLSIIFETISIIASSLMPGAVVYVTAQVPVGCCEKLLSSAIKHGASGVSIAYSPENLRLGQAIERFFLPALPVIGTDDDSTFAALIDLLKPFCSNWRRTDLRTAEMIKHALNCFLATNICFANELGNLCDELGADGKKIAELLRLEPRVGSKAMLMPGLGFSGGTLARDMVTLREFGDQYGIETPLLDGAWVSNLKQNRMVVMRLASLLGDPSTSRVCVFGLAYKPNTSTLRRSAAMEVIAELRSLGVSVSAHDPGVRLEDLNGCDFEFSKNLFIASQDSDALILMTPWSVYKTIDLKHLYGVMRGKLIFDTAQMWDAEVVQQHGFDYIDIGRGRRRSVVLKAM